MNMNQEKWETYFKFCFIRNPYDRIISAWNHVNRFKIPFKNFLNLKNTCNDVEFMHMFMPQYRSMINEKAKLFIDYIGHFETFEEDFQIILKKLNILSKHNQKEKLNSRKHKPFYEYYDQESLNKVNLLMEEDFNNLNYEKIETIEEFNNKFNN